jgi:hypothetical protein
MELEMGLEILIAVAVFGIFAAAVVLVLFSAIAGAGLSRLLYLGARSFANRVLPNFVPFHQPVVVVHKGARH